MKFELFVARRMLSKEKSAFSGAFVRIAIISVALGMVMMILSDSILSGFQMAIRDKIAGFSGHIRISPFSDNESWETEPVAKYQDFYSSILEIPGVKHIQVYATKAGIIKTENQIEGVVLKGVDSDFDWHWFDQQIIEGSSFRVVDTAKKTNNILVSSITAKRLNISLGDDVRMYFVNNEIARGRKFVVSGIYDTGLGEFDKMYVLCDIRHIQKLNNWEDNQVAGFEIITDDFGSIDKVNQAVYEFVPFDLNARTIREIYPQMFDWLALQDTNVIVIMVLMVLVAGITMISTLLILILERTRMIGVFKALGASNKSIRTIFILNAVKIVGKGLLWGNLIALTLALVQNYTGVITLPQESYYVSTVPVHINVLHILFINMGTAVVCFSMLLVPSYIISRIDPVKSIRMD